VSVTSSASIAASRALLALAAAVASNAATANSCNPPSPPIGSGGAWFSAYQGWCRSCGGTPSSNASPARCDPGPNWGGASSGSGGMTPGQALGHEIGTAAGGLLACALFDMCPGRHNDPATDQTIRQEIADAAARQRALVDREDARQQAEMAASRDRLSLALRGGGGLQVRDLSGTAPVDPQALRQYGAGVWLSQRAWRAVSPQQSAEVANRAFDAALGGIDDGVPENAAQVGPDSPLAAQFLDLRQNYFQSHNAVRAKMDMWVELVEHRHRVVKVRQEAHAKAQAQLEAEAAKAEAEYEKRIRQTRDELAGQQPALRESARKVADTLADAGDDKQRSREDFYNRGYQHAEQCFSPNPGLACAGLAPDAQKACNNDYGSGYKLGEQRRRELLASANEQGRSDRAGGRKHSGFVNPGAAGPCRIDWIAAYTDGYQGAASPAFR
jgi:hypothetical protein